MYILWKHISDLYNEVLIVGCGLTADHIYLNSYSKMRVKLATQILSESVGHILKSFGPPDAKETAEFYLKFDAFFDCLNVRNTQEHVLKRKPFLRPYEKKDDQRFKWLNSFIQYLDDWKDSIDEREGEFSSTDKNNMFLPSKLTMVLK